MSLRLAATPEAYSDVGRVEFASSYHLRGGSALITTALSFLSIHAACPSLFFAALLSIHRDECWLLASQAMERAQRDPPRRSPAGLCIRSEVFHCCHSNLIIVAECAQEAGAAHQGVPMSKIPCCQANTSWRSTCRCLSFTPNLQRCVMLVVTVHLQHHAPKARQVIAL